MDWPLGRETEFEQSIGTRIMKKIKFVELSLIAFAILGVMAAGFVGAILQVGYDTAEILLPYPKDYQKDELDVWIDHLGRHENCVVEVKNGELIGTMDSGSYSYGIMCFKRDTFIMFVRKYKLLPEATDDEIMNFVGDNFFTKNLTRLIILDRHANWAHWKTSTLGFTTKDGRKIIGVGYPPKI